MQVILRNNGNGRQDAAYVVTKEMDVDGVIEICGYWGKWSAYLMSNLDGLHRTAKAASDRYWEDSFVALLASKMDRGYKPIDNHEVTARIANYLSSRGFYLDPEPAPPAAKPVTVTGGLAFAQNLAKMQPAPPAPKPEPAPQPKPKPARPKTRAAMLEW